MPPGVADQPTWLANLLEEGYFRIRAGATDFRLGEHTVPALPAGDSATMNFLPSRVTS